jgi:hypothetical protein
VIFMGVILRQAMMSRRAFLLAALALAATSRRAGAAPVVRSAPYRAQAALVFGLFRFTLNGVWEDEVDRAAGRYRVRLAGEGLGAKSTFESTGVITSGRFAPTATRLRLDIRTRQNRTDITYDHDRRVAHYEHRGETFFRGRVRTGRNTVAVPEGEVVDDFASIVLNHGAGLFDPPGKVTRVLVLNRARRQGEGLDAVDADGTRGELLPLSISYGPDPDGTGTVSTVDVSGLSTWAKAGDPMTFTFTADRQIERIEAQLALGTSIRVTFIRQ